MRRRRCVLLALALCCLASNSALAQRQRRAASSAGVPLRTYLDALAERRLVAAEAGTANELRALVRRGEQRLLEGRFDAAVVPFFEVAESPRYADFSDMREFLAAEYMLARALVRLGALRSAARYLERVIQRGAEQMYFAPAFRKLVDVALQSGNLRAALERIEALGLEQLPDDAQNELRYLRGRAHYDRGRLSRAESELSGITRQSRFFSNAQYLRGAMAAQAEEYDRSEQLLCSVASIGRDQRFGFFVDDRYFEVQDLARLGLGRVAHEMGRSDDAFYYYFQVPNDSERVAEAMFEAAYAMYEGGHMDTAMDLLEQLEARFPDSGFVDEAALLRGYVYLGRCDFERATDLFVEFVTTFGPIVAEINRILENPARQRRLYEELLEAEHHRTGRSASGSQLHSLLLAMLRVDPEFYRLHADVRLLEAEAARASRAGPALAQIAARIRGAERPAAAAELDAEWHEGDGLRRNIDEAEASLARLTEQLDAMRRADGPAGQLRQLEEQVGGLSARLSALRGRMARLLGAIAPARPARRGTTVEQYMDRDVRYARTLPARVAATRAHMVAAGNSVARVALHELAGRLAAELRRARIGRIDAVMGAKRRVEIQIESLAAGEFPPELQNPLMIQGLLRDDEEYWPFEGELWQDEFEEDAEDVDDGAGEGDAA